MAQTTSQLLALVRRPVIQGLIANAFLVINGLITGPILARSLGPTGRGLLASMLLYPTILAGVLACGLPLANTYHATKDRSISKALFANSLWYSLGLGLPVGLGMVLLQPFFTGLWGSATVFASVGTVVMTVSGCFSASILGLMLGHENFALYNLLKVVQVASNVLPIVFLKATGHLCLVNAFWVYLVSNVLMALLVTEIAYHMGIFCASPDVRQFQISIRYGIRVIPGSLANMANMRLDQLLMAPKLGPTALGLYAMATTISGLLGNLAGPINMVLIPRVGKLEMTQGSESVARTTRLYVCVAGVTAVSMVLLATPMFGVLLGRAYYPAIPAYRVLVFATLGQGMASILATGLAGLGFPLASTVGEGTALVLTLSTLPVMITRYGVIGGAVASCISYWVNFLAVVIYGSAKAKIHPNRLIPRYTDVIQLVRLVLG